MSEGEEIATKIAALGAEIAAANRTHDFERRAAAEHHDIVAQQKRELASEIEEHGWEMHSAYNPAVPMLLVVGGRRS